MLEHGGRLRRAAQRHGIALGEWLDLSTGISPWSWAEENPLLIPASAWSRLPEDDDDLAEAARGYYGSAALPVAGSQAAIQVLPQLRGHSRIGIPMPSYAEHASQWQRAGHELIAIDGEPGATQLDRLDVLLLVQPNNPDGRRYSRDSLLGWHEQLSARGGWLVVDEAFADAQPRTSLAPESSREGLVVLRSLGKFFGLAGARVGFVLAAQALRNSLQELIGPWSVAGPSRAVAAAALRDTRWQTMQRERIQRAGKRLQALLQDSRLSPHGGCELFQWIRTSQAREIHEALAAQGVLTRLFDEPASLRFGLPRQEGDWERLASALASLGAPCR